MNQTHTSKNAVAGAGLAIALASILNASPVRADSDEYFKPVDHAATKTECKACHMAFPASMLPARSWQAIMDTLPDHFGEDASLEEKTRAEITAYLTGNAAPEKSRIAKSVAKSDQPVLRISDMPWWVRAHDGEVSPKAFENPKVGSKANCVACHSGAEKGYFEDD